MDKLFIHKLVLDALIGVHPHERHSKQPICIDLELGIDITKPAKTDNIEDALCYDSVVRSVSKFVEQSEFSLIEALAENLSQHLLQQFPIQTIKLRIHKPGVVANTKAVGLMIERQA